ncbi:two-component sensor [Salinicola rhizosphaerae]|uniref:histidine kinase n=2 Tax=Salinicola rhizosphaerae TaxID=1443141 RepID=A0ABQ3E8D3_9GAMM|nr:two-component sensor [Salinicola rhizosphaerae]
MGLTWLLHGILLKDVAREFLAGRLQQEAEYIFSRLGPGDLPLAPIEQSVWPDTSVFHHVYLVRRGAQVYVSPADGVRALAPYLDGPEDKLLDLHWQGRHLLAWRERQTIRGAAVTVLVGEDFAQVDQGLARLHLWIGASAALISLILLALSFAVVQRGLRPLKSLTRQLEALRRGERARLDIGTVSELEGVIAQINELVDEQQFRQQRMRQSLANLSHAIKTPLAAVIQALSAPSIPDERRREAMVHRLRAIDEKLSEELRRSRIAGQATGQRRLDVADVESMLSMLETLYPGIDFDIDPGPEALCRLPLERHDAMECLGILLDNGGKWARSRVMVDVSMPDRLVVEDDGPGVDRAHLASLGERGTRLDEQKPGHGLGLSILAQLIERYQGRVKYDQSAFGGLRIELHFSPRGPQASSGS